MKISKEVTRQIRSWALKHAGGHRKDAPIIIVEGDQSPNWKGCSFYWTTKTGKPVYYPNAYRKAWGKTIYVRSSIRIEVGKNWVILLQKDLLHLKLFKKYKRVLNRKIVEFNYNFGIETV